MNEIRLAINSPAVPGWNEIDAVAIVPADPVNVENIERNSPGFLICIVQIKNYISSGISFPMNHLGYNFIL
ncbi:MAG: hypothetical protein IPI90_20085 [Saprospiraceae bacterium]|nr:hypothetical protein [Candidatus Vicinibacter affinis]